MTVIVASPLKFDYTTASVLLKYQLTSGGVLVNGLNQIKSWQTRAWHIGDGPTGRSMLTLKVKTVRHFFPFVSGSITTNQPSGLRVAPYSFLFLLFYLLQRSTVLKISYSRFKSILLNFTILSEFSMYFWRSCEIYYFKLNINKNKCKLAYANQIL